MINLLLNRSKQDLDMSTFKAKLTDAYQLAKQRQKPVNKLVWYYLLKDVPMTLIIRYEYYANAYTNFVTYCAEHGVRVMLMDVAMGTKTIFEPVDYKPRGIQQQPAQQLIPDGTANVFTGRKATQFNPDVQVVYKKANELKLANINYHTVNKELKNKEYINEQYKQLEARLYSHITEIKNNLKSILPEYDEHNQYDVLLDDPEYIGRRYYWLYNLPYPRSDREAYEIGLQFLAYIAYGIMPSALTTVQKNILAGLVD